MAAPEVADFILSLTPSMTYALNQMWSTHAAVEGRTAGRLPSAELTQVESLERWCENLRAVTEQLTGGSFWKHAGDSRGRRILWNCIPRGPPYWKVSVFEALSRHMMHRSTARGGRPRIEVCRMMARMVGNDFGVPGRVAGVLAAAGRYVGIVSAATRPTW
jgi:hypothetical protein